MLYIGIIGFGSLLLTGCEPMQEELQEERVELVMRKIGHEVLLTSGDSTSVVKPVTKVENKYRIEFAAFFGFYPDSLVSTIDNILANSLGVERYFVEVMECQTENTIYSYEIGLIKDSSFIPCQLREQPFGCYELYITLLDTPSSSNKLYYWWLLLLLPLAFVLVVRQQKKEATTEDVYIGNYRFNKNKLTLELKSATTELSHKEAELLNLLYQHLNTPVKRETILNEVWEDEGDYIGRTLDVFISKLRKKLEGDPRIQLKNLRGIGYKLTIDG